MRAALAVLLFAWPLAAAHAEVLCVNPGGTGGCFATIQAAIDAAFNDEIEVAAGTYPGHLDVHEFAVSGRTVIRGAGPGATIIQGSIDVNFHASLDLEGVTLDGGGVVVDNESFLELSDCEITNTMIGIQGDEPYDVRVTDCAIHDNSSNGIFVFGDPGDTPPRVTVTRSTISGNGFWGIIIDAGGVSLRVDDSTISGNGMAGIEAGGFEGRLKVRVRRSTIAGNGGGIVADASAPQTFVGVRLESSIVANSTAGPDLIGLDARLLSRGFNLIEAVDPGTPLRAKSSDILGVDPALGPLQNNGGPTETHALLPGSPALGVIPRTARCREPDQRGVPRAVPCDIGAFEAP